MPWTPPKPSSTHVYKKVDDLEIGLDLYLPTTGTGNPSPVMLWFHPGSWIDGARTDVALVQLYCAIARGWAFVSADYRLCPQVKLKDILADALDAVTYISEGNLGSAVDAKKLVISGSSAGGLLALVSSQQCPEPPLATFAIYPACNLTSPSVAAKVQFPNTIKWDDVKEYLDPNAPVTAHSPGNVDFTTFTPYDRTRAAFYAVQEGKMLDYILGPGVSPAPYDVKDLFKRYSRVVIIHGTADKMVPYDVSTKLVSVLEAGKMDHLLITVEGADHGFDLLVQDPSESAEGRKPFEEAMDWLDKLL